MAIIFLSFSSKDCDAIKTIIDKLGLLQYDCNLLYFMPPYTNINMRIILKSLDTADLFIIFVSHNSLGSKYVQRELKRAIRLAELGKIKEICPILLDNSIDMASDSRVPGVIRSCNVRLAKSTANAAQIALEFIQKY